jgi:hypothetical protein
MKTTFPLLLIVLLGLLLACEKEERKKGADFCQYLPTFVEGHSTYLGNLKLPDKSAIVQYDSSYFEVIFPEGVFLVYRNEGNQLCYAKKETYTCTCSGSSGGCTVFYGEDIGFGCQHSNCSGTCTGKKGSSALQDFALIDMNRGISFLDKDAKTDELFDLKAIVLEVPEVNNALADFVKKHNIPTNPSKSSNYCAINLFGCYALIPAPTGGEKFDPAHIKYVKPRFSCSCGGTGSGGCKADSHWSGIVYCRNTVCSECTMTVE